LRRLLASVLLGSALLALPAQALAFDYAEPVIPVQFRAGAPDPALGAGQATTAAAVNTVYSVGVANPQSEPPAPSYVPRNPWDEGDGGCALWAWNVC
jgi:hypothetical protein